VSRRPTPEGDAWPGRPYPLGATWDGEGTNFALASENATGVELCLFSAGGQGGKEKRVRLTERTDFVWHVYLPRVGPGQRYGYRVEGPFEPEQGMRFNPHKLLLDPYARAIDGTVRWSDANFGYRLGDPAADLSLDERDNREFVPRGVVVDASFDWGDDRRPGTALHRSIIYETHLRGMTMKHPDVPAELRGTYSGMASEPVLDYLDSLGVTAVELLPVHQFVSDKILEDRGLVNYWGYNTIGFFAPDARYSSTGTGGEQVSEFKSMVKAIHERGIEVILDVVYNHTAEGNELGPTLSFRGIDNAMYYRLVEDQPRYYMDYTGTGNTLNVGNPRVLQLVMDSLRYLVTEMHVDGFRFDLAAALARELHDVDRLATFFDTIGQDPIVSQVKLIAEPWDVGPGGYQVGNFPPGWAEWNGRYRDAVRSFWRGDPIGVAELAYRLSGSSDLYEDTGRRPYASINFVTAHDGFTLNDLVSFDQKHNEANGEDNQDGEDNNLSWNCGAEGPTDDPEVAALRGKQKRNLLATLLFSQGVPMISGGDEHGRTQGGNNNAYCQDNEISWYDWDFGDDNRALLDFTRTLIRLRKEHPVLRRRKYFQGRRLYGSDIDDIAFIQPNGTPMSDETWELGWIRALGMLLNGAAIAETDEQGRRIVDDVLLLLINGDSQEQEFKLPENDGSAGWDVLVDTNEPSVGSQEVGSQEVDSQEVDGGAGEARAPNPGGASTAEPDTSETSSTTAPDVYLLQPRTLALLRRRPAGGDAAPGRADDAP
jgi:isoamylase